MTPHKNVQPHTKKCQAVKSGWPRIGDSCKKWATYAIIRGSIIKYVCTQHYSIEADHVY
jgi:hypothetical protein